MSGPEMHERPDLAYDHDGAIQPIDLRQRMSAMALRADSIAEAMQARGIPFNKLTRDALCYLHDQLTDEIENVDGMEDS